MVCQCHDCRPNYHNQSIHNIKNKNINVKYTSIGNTLLNYLI